MTDYPRPHFDKYCGSKKRPAAPKYPYPRSMLENCDIFDIFVFDGGAFFFTQEHLGGKDTKRFLKALQSGKLLEPWKKDPKVKNTRPGNINWMAAYNPEESPWAKGQTVEQHVWMNRLYFLLPIAQEFLRTGRKNWARLWLDYLNDWIENSPPPDEKPDDTMRGTRFVWHDMQITWRLLVLIHSVFMIGDTPKALERDEWLEVYRTIQTHAERVFDEVKGKGVTKGSGNHFLQKGAALVYAGTLYPELPGAATWLETGRKVITNQMKREIYADGGSIEASPSYSHFIARLYVDAYLTLKANKKPQIDGLKRCISNQYRFLTQTASPDMLALQIGDSYPLDVRRDLEIVNEVLPLEDVDRNASVCFKKSQFTVLRSPTTAVYLDAMPGGLWHIHRGKPNVLVYYREKPVIVDSGCVNYDHREEKEGYLKTRAAHNVVEVEPVEDDENPGSYTVFKIAKFQDTDDGGTVTVTCRYRGKGSTYQWKRTVELSGSTVEITDHVTSQYDLKCVLHFHLADCTTSDGSGSFSARGKGWKLAARCVSSTGKELAPTIRTKPAIDCANERYKAPDVLFRQSGRSSIYTTTLKLKS